MIDQVPADVFVQQVGSQSLVRDTFFQCTGLKVFQVTTGDANVQSLVFLECGASGCFVGIAGLVVLVSFISPFKSELAMARSLFE